MQLYHGSEHVIEYPQPWLGRKQNDYGQGFYCTKAQKIACEWAVLHNSNGFINEYRLDEEGLNILDLLNGDYNILNWLALLLKNRIFRIDNEAALQAKSFILQNFSVSCDDADIIIGYRGDDSYFSVASAFLNNELSLTGFEQAMKLGSLGEQIFIKSRQAFNGLEYIESSPVFADEYYPLWVKRDISVRTSFNKMEGIFKNDTYIADIVHSDWRNDDERLQRIVRI